MKQLFVSRVLRDVSDGVMVLNPDGTAAFLNPSGRSLLGIREEFQNRKYAALMEASPSPDNDSFHQLVLDSVYDKDKVHRKEVGYTQPGGRRLYLLVRTSFLYEDDKRTPAGIIIQFSDVTERVVLLKKQKDFMAAFTAMVSILCGWIFLYAAWDVSGRGAAHSQGAGLHGLRHAPFRRSVPDLPEAEVGVGGAIPHFALGTVASFLNFV